MGSSGRAFRCIVTVLNRKGVCWGKFLESGLEFSFEDTVACVCGVGHGVPEPFPQWSCVAVTQAWGHIAVSLALPRKNSTDELAAFLHTSQYLRFYKNVLKIGT